MDEAIYVILKLLFDFALEVWSFYVKIDGVFTLKICVYLNLCCSMMARENLNLLHLNNKATDQLVYPALFTTRVITFL